MKTSFVPFNLGLTRRARGRLDSHRFLAFFVALGFIRFGSESRPSSRR
jgi:hypothetical protein